MRTTPYYLDRRWPVGVFDVDTFGKLKDIGRFDAPFFNFTEDEANQCAPDVRIMLEVAWETVVDSGYDPAELANTPTGVYIGQLNRNYLNVVKL